MDLELLDVRPILARGEEPFGAIMTAKARLQPGSVLRVIAPFEPVPLYAMFKAEGYEARAKQVGPAEWWIEFHPLGTEADDSESGEPEVGTKDLDLRSLEPAASLQKCLEALHCLGRRETLVLHTCIRPVNLFAQIEDEPFDYDCEKKSANHWATHIWRMGA